MSEALVQAVERLLVVFICGGIAALLAVNFAPLGTALGQYSVLIIPILAALFNAILKYLGGATMPVSTLRTGILAADRPHWWAA